MRRPRQRIASAIVGALFALTNLGPVWARGTAMGGMWIPRAMTPAAMASGPDMSMGSMDMSATDASMGTGKDAAPSVPCGGKHSGQNCCPCCPCCETSFAAVRDEPVLEVSAEPPRAEAPRNAPSAIRPTRVDAAHPYANGPPVIRLG